MLDVFWTLVNWRLIKNQKSSDLFLKFYWFYKKKIIRKRRWYKHKSDFNFNLCKLFGMSVKLAIRVRTTYIRFKVFLQWKWYTTLIFKCRKYFNLTLKFICLRPVNSHSSIHNLFKTCLIGERSGDFWEPLSNVHAVLIFLVREFEIHLLLCVHQDCLIRIVGAYWLQYFILNYVKYPINILYFFLNLYKI